MGRTNGRDPGGVRLTPVRRLFRRRVRGLRETVENLIARLPELCGRDVSPALLHGDAQQDNFLTTTTGAVAIDPAVYFGNPEVDPALDEYVP